MTRFVTFYSWKGGVGRTMALANVAVQLARRGRKVLMVDFDLEAPGLNQYFVKADKQGQNQLQVTPAENNTGMLGLLTDAMHGTELTPSAWQSRLTKIVLPPMEKSFSTPIIVEPEVLHLLPSGHGQDGYPSILSAFSWDAFYQQADGDNWLEAVRDDWKRYDFVLIDSRTGLTDTGGICTVHFPDWMVLCFTANDQSFEGGLRIVDAAHEARRNYHRDRDLLSVIPLLSRWGGESEVDLGEQWMQRICRQVEPLTEPWLSPRLRPRDFIEAVRVPHVSRFSFGEPLPVLTHSISDASLPGLFLDRLASYFDADLSDESLALPFNDIEAHLSSIYQKLTIDPKWVSEWIRRKEEDDGFALGVP